MYSKITNPNTGKKVNVYGKYGIDIIKNYIEILNNHIGGDQERKKDMKKKKQHKKSISIKVLHYNGTISGSRELRKYNQAVVSKMYNTVDSDIQGTPHHYFKEYDKLKSAEPFYDAFVVHLAHLKPKEYLNYGLERIEYIKQDLSEEDIT